MAAPQEVTAHGNPPVPPAGSARGQLSFEFQRVSRRKRPGHNKPARDISAPPHFDVANPAANYCGRVFADARTSPYRVITSVSFAGLGTPPATTSATSRKYCTPISGVRMMSARAGLACGLLKAWTEPRGVYIRSPGGAPERVCFNIAVRRVRRNPRT